MILILHGDFEGEGHLEQLYEENSHSIMVISE